MPSVSPCQTKSDAKTAQARRGDKSRRSRPGENHHPVKTLCRRERRNGPMSFCDGWPKVDCATKLVPWMSQTGDYTNYNPRGGPAFRVLCEGRGWDRLRPITGEVSASSRHGHLQRCTVRATLLDIATFRHLDYSRLVGADGVVFSRYRDSLHQIGSLRTRFIVAPQAEFIPRL